MTLKQKLITELTLNRYSILVNSTDGSFEIPKGFEDIWTDRDKFFEAVKEQVIWHVNQIYAIDQLSRIEEGDISAVEYALLEETIARYIDLTVHSAMFKERMNAYSIQLEQGYKYEAKDVKLVKPSDILPRTIISALNNIGIRPQIESYNVRTGVEEDDEIIDIEPWQFKDNKLSPETLNWGDKFDTTSGQALNKKIDDEIVEGTSRDTKIAELEAKTMNIVKDNTSDGITEFKGSIKLDTQISLTLAGDEDLIQAKAVKDLASELRIKDASLQTQITDVKTTADTAKTKNDEQDNALNIIREELATNQENIEAIGSTVGDIILFEATLDHSTDVDGTVAGDDKTFDIPYAKVTVEDPNDATKTTEIIPQRISQGNKIDISIYDGTHIGRALFTVGKTSAQTISIGAGSVHVKSIADNGSNLETFKIIITENNQDNGAQLANIKVHEVILDKAQVNGQSMTQTIADARYTKKVADGVLGGTTGNGTDADVITNITELWAKAKNNEADNDELNKGKFDVNGDGTKITEIFDADGTLKQTVKDLTHLTTQDEYYNAMEENGVYKIKVGTYEFTTTSNVRKFPTLIEVSIMINSSAVTTISQLVIKKGNTTPLSAPTSQINVGTPTEDTNATTKKYVDDNKYSLPQPIKHSSGKVSSYLNEIKDAYKRGDVVTLYDENNNGFTDGTIHVYGPVKANIADASGSDINNISLTAITYIQIGQLYA